MAEKDTETNAGAVVEGAADDVEAMRVEVEELRAQNAQLAELAKASREPTPAPTARRRARLSVTLAVIGGLLLPLGTMTMWVRNQLLDTDRYVETVTPLASDPAIQAAVTNRVTEVIVEEADFEGLAKEILPDEADRLSGFLAGGAENLTRTAVDKLVTSDQFSELWIEANRLGHEGAVAVLTGQGNDAVSTESGKVVISLGPLAEQVLGQLDSRFNLGLADRIPAEKLNIRYALVDSPDLARLQSEIKLFDRLSWLTAILAIASLVAAIFVADDRRKGIRRTGVAISVSMFVLLLVYAASRSIYMSNLPDGTQSPEAAGAVFDILTRFLQRTLRAFFILGLVLLIVAWFSGPSRSAARVRGWWDASVGPGGCQRRRVGTGARMGRVPRERPAGGRDRSRCPRPVRMAPAHRARRSPHRRAGHPRLGDHPARRRTGPASRGRGRGDHRVPRRRWCGRR